jgi:hypothetical protein
MKRLFMAAAAVCLGLASALPASAAMVTLPAGTKVSVSLLNGMSSGNVTAGQSFTFQAAAPVVINNRVVIAKGASGTGHVAKVSKARGKSAGELTLQFSNVHAVDGRLVGLTEASSSKGNPEKGKASTATIAATIALGPLGLFAHNMVKGKDVVIKPGQTFPAWVKSNTAINVH